MWERKVVDNALISIRKLTGAWNFLPSICTRFVLDSVSRSEKSWHCSLPCVNFEVPMVCILNEFNMSP